MMTSFIAFLLYQHIGNDVIVADKSANVKVLIFVALQP